MVDKMLHCNWHEYSIQCSIFHIYLQQYKQILHQQEMLRQQNKIIYTKKKKRNLHIIILIILWKIVYLKKKIVDFFIWSCNTRALVVATPHIFLCVFASRLWWHAVSSIFTSVIRLLGGCDNEVAKTFFLLTQGNLDMMAFIPAVLLKYQFYLTHTQKG